MNKGVETIDEDIHWVGVLFGAGAGALSASISIIFINLTLRPGWFFGVNTDLITWLEGLFFYPTSCLYRVYSCRNYYFFPWNDIP